MLHSPSHRRYQMPIAPIVIIAAAACVIVCYVVYRVIDLRAQIKFERWKAAHSDRIGRDAIRGSQNALMGRVSERVAPYLPNFGFNPRDARFIGDPVDFIVFDGLSEGEVRRVIFVEVKTGAGTLNGNERKVRTAIQERRVQWSLLHLTPGDSVTPRPAAKTR